MTERMMYGDVSEGAVLTSMLQNRDALDLAIQELKPEDFGHPDTRLLFETIRDITDQNRDVNIMSVSAELEKKNKLAGIGGADRLVTMMQDFVDVKDPIFYIRDIKGYAILRGLIQGCSDIVHRCYNQTEEPSSLLDQAEKTIFSIAQRRECDTEVTMKDALHECLDTLDAIKKRGTGTIGLETGFPLLDKLTSGFQKGNLIILAARPSMGKTSLALDIIRHCILQETPVVFFSFEMTKNEVTMRLLSATSNIPHDSIKTGRFSDAEAIKIHEAADRLSEAPLAAYYNIANQSPGVIRSLCRRQFRRFEREGKKLGLVVIDYIQRMTSDSGKENRQQEVADISRALKNVALELDVPVLALSQLNRNTEQKERGGKPRLSDLRDSGGLEQDADLVMFIYRQALYEVGVPIEKRRETQLIVGKHRNGALGEVPLLFMEDKATFVNWDRREDSDERYGD